MLGELVTALEGRPWDEVVTTDLLDPLGMTRTSARPIAPSAPGLAVHPFADVVLPEPGHDAGAMAPAGQLWSTVTDLARWAAFAAGDTAGLLERGTLDEALEPRVVDDRVRQPWTTAHGLGWQVLNVAGTRTVGHGGSMPGFLAGLWVRRDTGDAVVTLANATSAGLAHLGLASGLLDLMATEEPARSPPWHAVGDTRGLDLSGYLGRLIAQEGRPPWWHGDQFSLTPVSALLRGPSAHLLRGTSMTTTDVFAGAAVLITGANRGLGSALVDEALRRGAGRVYAASRHMGRYADARVTPMTLDVTDRAQVVSVARDIETLDVLVNNAGVGAMGIDLTERTLRDHLEVNLFGTARVATALMAQLTASQGRVVNVSSLVAISALPLMASYSVSKAAALSLTQSQRALLAGQGVRVHAVLAGPIDTDMSRDVPLDD